MIKWMNQSSMFIFECWEYQGFKTFILIFNDFKLLIQLLAHFITDFKAQIIVFIIVKYLLKPFVNTFIYSTSIWFINYYLFFN